MRPREIKKLIELVEASSINELEVSRFGKKVSIRKNMSGASMANNAAETVVAVPPPVAAPQVSTPVAAPAPPPVSSEKPDKSAAVDSNIIEIRSPMVGTFYSAPAPDADPYVQSGDIIKPKQVLCIIEAMKLMNEIESETKGRIIEVVGEDGKPVEYDQVLFKIEKL